MQEIHHILNQVLELYAEIEPLQKSINELVEQAEIEYANLNSKEKEDAENYIQSIRSYQN